MKEIALLFLVSMWTIAFANAEEATLFTTMNPEKTSREICEQVWWEFITLESYPVQEKCSMNWTNIGIDSLKDKYNHFILWLMIKYTSEYKYSNSGKWKNYLEFFAQDIEDTKTFRSWVLSDEQKENIDEYLKVQESLYNYMKVKSDIWERNATLLEKALDKYVTNLNKEDTKKFYDFFLSKLTKKIEEMEDFQMVTRFTQEWYRKFLLKLNAYRYLKILVDGRLE